MPRIISFDELVAMPSGTLYWEYKPEIFYNMAIFVRPIVRDEEDCSDFWLIDLVPWRAYPEDDLAFADALSRWGAYDREQLFCVLDKDEIELFKSRLDGNTSD